MDVDDFLRCVRGRVRVIRFVFREFERANPGVYSVLEAFNSNGFHFA